MSDHDHRHGIIGCRTCAEIAADDSRRIEAERAVEEATNDEIASLRRDILQLEGDRDAAMQSARLAQEAVERFVVAGEKVRAELATILAERDAAVSMGTQLERELAARTEELAKAKAELAFVRSIYGEVE